MYCIRSQRQVGLNMKHINVLPMAQSQIDSLLSLQRRPTQSSIETLSVTRQSRMATIITIIVFIRIQVKINTRTQRDNHIRIRAHTHMHAHAHIHIHMHTPTPTLT